MNAQLPNSRICNRCQVRQPLDRFRTSMGDGKGKINKLCSNCLDDMYRVTKSTNLDNRYWSQLAYRVNYVAKRRAARELRQQLAETAPPMFVSADELVGLFEGQDRACFYCKVGLTKTNISVDHKVPYCKNGRHELANLCLSCIDCNHLKYGRTASEFAQFVQIYAQRFVKQQN